MIFGMRAGEHERVGRQQRDALAVEIVVGDDVEGDAHAVEPAGEMRVGRQVAQPRAERVVERDIVRPPG